MFGLNTHEPMPIEFLTSHEAWDNYVAEVWADLISSCEFNKESIVVEIGPGASTKIGGALAKLSFEGTLYVIDALESVIDVLKPKYKALLPKADIRFICCPLAEGYLQLPKRIDYLLGSHIFDDMIIAEACLKKNGDKKALDWSSNYGFKPSHDLHAAWSNISADEKRLEEYKNKVLADLDNTISRSNPRYTIFNQHPSSALYENGMDDLNQNAFDVLKAQRKALKGKSLNKECIQGYLNNNKNYGNAHIGNNFLNSDYWVVGL